MLLTTYGPIFFIVATAVMYMIFIPLLISEWKHMREQERKLMRKK
ncbi:hypothetical protein [Bacilliculturomica massiliensis]|nr:hypothetical protein [Bacilliculturomica massiliensis]